MTEKARRKFSLISPGTRAFIKAARQTPDYSLVDFIHGYVYIRWPYQYIGLGKPDSPIAKKLAPLLKVWRWVFPPKAGGPVPTPSLTQASGTIADGYHGKALPLARACELVAVNEPLNLPDLEQVIPYVRARAIVQEHPDHIVALECPCRANQAHPCLPVDVCLVIGEPFASFVMEHHKGRAKRITQTEAIQILQEEDARGHVHHAFFKDAMLGRFYAICNCCECCCRAIHSHQNGTPMLASSGYIAEVDEDLCIACDTCAEYCQFGALAVDDGIAQIDDVYCMGCGVCISKCPDEALSLVLAPAKGVPLEIV